MYFSFYLLVNPILSAKQLSFNFLRTVKLRINLYSFRQTVQFNKNSTVGPSQSNAEKYNKQCKLANQHKVLVTLHRKSCRMMAIRW